MRCHARWPAAVLLTALLVTAPAAAIEPPTPVTFTDAVGQTLRLARLPRRILVLGDGTYVLAHLLYMFPEGRERLVGMERRGKSASDFLPLVDPTFESRSFLAPNPGPEQIVALHPDLVLVRGSSVDRRVAVFAEVGVPVAHFGLETPEQYLDEIGLLGRLLGNPGRAAEISAYYRDRLEATRRALAGLQDIDKPRVLLAMAMPRGERVAVQVPARSWMQTVQVTTAGGTPVWLESAEPTSGWTVVNIEQIASWNPDTILMVFWHSTDPGRGVAALRADPHWAALKAVKAGRLYAFPADLYGWDTPDPRWILGLLWTAAKLHPERLSSLDLGAEVDRFYHELYGMDRAAVAAAIRPTIRVPLN